MTDTYLLELEKALDEKQRNELSSLLDLEYFNNGPNAKELQLLHSIILKAAPVFSDTDLNKELVYEQVFSSQKVVSGKLDKLMGDLIKLIRKYVLSTRFLSDKNSDQHQIEWAAWLREIGMAEKSRQTITKLKNQKEQDREESLDWYRTRWLLAEEEHLWQSSNNRFKGDLLIPELTHHFDLYYLNYRLERINIYLLQQKGAQLGNWQHANIPEKLYLEQSILLQISKKITDILENDYPSTTEVFSLMQFLSENEAQLSFLTLDHTYAFLRSFCTLLINGGNLDFIPILHEIHIDNLARGYFFVNGAISPNSYLNLVQIATRANENNWAIEFTEEYRSRLVGGDEDNFFYKLNLSQCLFSSGDYDGALDNLPEVSSKSYYHHIVRRLELKIYYELRSDLLSYKMEAFRKFLERSAANTIAANVKKLHVNFVNMLLQLIQSPPKDAARSALLVSRIEKKKLIAERTWLIEKAKELG